MDELTEVEILEAKNKLANFTNQALEYFNQSSDYRKLAEKFYVINPYYYRDDRSFWVWDKFNYCWRRIPDEINLLNPIAHINQSIDTIKQANYITTALKQVGRDKAPKNPELHWIQFKDKVLDLKTGETFPATKDYFFLNSIPWKLGNSKDTPNLDKLLSEWVGADKIIVLKEIMASCCVAFNPLDRAFCLIGKGRNGKGMFKRLIIKLIGTNNATSSELNSLITNRFETSKLFGKTMVEVGEIDKSIFTKTAMIKRLTGGDLVSAEFKGKDSFDFYNYAKLIISTNVLPETTDKTDGFYSRWVIVNFPNQFEEGKNPLDRIPDYEFENFCSQIPELIKGIQERGHYSYEGSIEDRKNAYEANSSPLKKFIDEFFVKDVNGFIPFGEFYSVFKDYLQSEGFRQQSNIETSKGLKNLGYETKIKSYSEIVTNLEGKELAVQKNERCIFGFRGRAV